MKRIHNDKRSIVTISNELPKNTINRFSTNTNSPAPANNYSNTPNKEKTFVPVNPNQKVSSIVSPAVAEQADKVFGRAGNHSSVASSKEPSPVLPSPANSSLFSQYSSSNRPSALPQSQRPKTTLVAESHPVIAGAFSRTSTITPTTGTVIQTNIEGSPLPQYIGDRDFFEFVSCVTTVILAKKYAGNPLIMPQLAIMHAYAKGDAGRNIVNFQHMAANFQRKTNPFFNLDITQVISNENLSALPSQQVDKLRKLPGTRLVNVEESMVLPILNPTLDNKLVLRDENKPLSPEEKLSNLSGNSSPDFKLEHPVPCRVGNVIENRDVFYDLKNSESALKECNQVRNFYKNIVDSSMKTHQFLEEYLIRIQFDLPSNESHYVSDVITDLNENLNKFKETGNVDEMVQSYNHLLDKYGSFFASNKIPMNLITKIDLDNFLLDPQVKTDFLKVWDYLAKSPNSPAKEFCLSHFQTHPKKIFNDSAILVKPFLQYLEANPHFNDILFE